MERHQHAAPVHINWLKNQICVLGCLLRSHASNGNEFQTPGHRWLPAKHWDAWFLNSSNSKTIWYSWNLACYHGVASKCRGKFFVPFVAGSGICISRTSASRNKNDGFGRERPTFGDETISIASYCLQIFFSCQHRIVGVLCDFLWFFGVCLDIFMH